MTEWEQISSHIKPRLVREIEYDGEWFFYIVHTGFRRAPRVIGKEVRIAQKVWEPY